MLWTKAQHAVIDHQLFEHDRGASAVCRNRGSDAGRIMPSGIRRCQRGFMHSSLWGKMFRRDSTMPAPGRRLDVTDILVVFLRKSKEDEALHETEWDSQSWHKLLRDVILTSASWRLQTRPILSFDVGQAQICHQLPYCWRKSSSWTAN
jgi:hypothetical protein